VSKLFFGVTGLNIVAPAFCLDLGAYHFRRSCGAADFEIYDNDTAAIRSLSHVQQLPSKMDCVVPFDFPPGCTAKTYLDEVIAIVYRAPAIETTYVVQHSNTPSRANFSAVSGSEHHVPM
jgi:hypothetical protein